MPAGAAVAGAAAAPAAGSAGVAEVAGVAGVVPLGVAVGGAANAIADPVANAKTAVVTANVEHFRPLYAALVQRGQITSGLVLLSSSRFVLARASSGRLVDALDAFLVGHPGLSDLACLEHWL